mgnify:CR=1 FL=1
MTDTQDIFTKEVGEFKVQSRFRRYDIVDMITISFYNMILFGTGLGVGWLIWVYD